MATFNITSIVNYSAAAEQRREEALRGLALPMEGGYVRGVVPREYLRIHAEAEAAPGGAAQVTLHLHDEARAAGLEVFVYVDEYNSPAQYIIRAGSLPALIVESCGRGHSRIIDGESGFPVDDVSYGAWSKLFRVVAAASKS